MSTFNMDTVPFSLLDAGERQLLLEHLDIAYFQRGETIIKANSAPEGVHIIVKGRVRESEAEGADDQVYVHYESGEYFGSWSSMRGQAIHDFIAEEETICHILPTAILHQLLQSNARFADYFQQPLSAKRELVAQYEESQDMAEFMLLRIRNALIRDPLIVNEGTSIEEAVRLLFKHKADCLLVERGQRYGMVTKTDLLNALACQHRGLDADVTEIASFRLFSVSPDEYLFQALVMMTEQQIARVVVMEGATLIGIVELTDVLSHFSSHSHVIGLRIERASWVEQLKQAAAGLNDLIRALLSSGVKIRMAMELLAAMNGRLIGKLFELLVPKDMHPHVCLLVLGSEGRGEQILKTDQDNALIYRDDLVWPGMQDTMKRFSEQLIEFGFPPCPGNIMVSNPEWVNSVSDWTGKLSDWQKRCEGEPLLRLAIAVDAHPVAGNVALFKVARNWFFRQLDEDQVFFSYFARAAVEFGSPLNIFGGLGGRDSIDIKKAGIFPIVHGVRTLALEQKISATNSFRRLDELVTAGCIDASDAQEVGEALALFVQLRLRQQIKRMEASEDGQDPTPNKLVLAELGKADRELLREGLQVVKQFRRHLQLRYHLGGM